MPIDLIPAAEYLRRSTEHQQYSLENQSAAIRRYAEKHGFAVIRSYSDSKTGVVLALREGLQSLLKDVTSNQADYRAILVYDVSRWGRFVDNDEAAHYEFICKAEGIPVHYCAESFENDGSLPSLIIKALKRTMAGEYVRELSVKVTAGQRRLIRLGFKQGGAPGYGLRRMLVGPNRKPKQLLDDYEQKSLATDRVILVPGPAHEVKVVGEIYDMLNLKGLSVHAIAAELTRRGIAYVASPKWDYNAVYGILTGLKYIGCQAFGRTSAKLYTPVVHLPVSQWLVVSGCFEPIVDYPTFAQAQQIIYYRSLNKSSEELLWMLRNLLAREGRLSGSSIERAFGMTSPSTYKSRFGSLRRAYELIDYGHSRQFAPIDLRRRTQALRDELIAQLTELFPTQVTVVSRGGKWRPFLHVQAGDRRVTVSVLISRSLGERSRGKRWGKSVWVAVPTRPECGFVTLLTRLNPDNLTFFDFHVLPNLNRQKKFHMRQNDPWLLRGERIKDLSEFCDAVDRASRLS
jgi:DNA invertase Pin-like site-specific DNA recombinase